MQGRLPPVILMSLLVGVALAATGVRHQPCTSRIPDEDLELTLQNVELGRSVQSYCLIRCSLKNKSRQEVYVNPRGISWDLERGARFWPVQVEKVYRLWSEYPPGKPPPQPDDVRIETGKAFVFSRLVDLTGGGFTESDPVEEARQERHVRRLPPGEYAVDVSLHFRMTTGADHRDQFSTIESCNKKWISVFLDDTSSSMPSASQPQSETQPIEVRN